MTPEYLKISPVVRQVNEDEQIVYAEVYAPYTLDTYGESMTPEAVKQMAHDFIAGKEGVLSLNTLAVDTNHDNVPNGSYIVESFIARDSDPDYAPGAWVVGIKIPDAALWAKVRKGDLNGLSMEALVYKVPAIVEVLVDLEKVGETAEANGHTHLYYLEFNEDGRVIGGRTSTDENHSHTIRSGTATEPEMGHSHRIFT